GAGPVRGAVELPHPRPGADLPGPHRQGGAVPGEPVRAVLLRPVPRPVAERLHAPGRARRPTAAPRTTPGRGPRHHEQPGRPLPVHRPVLDRRRRLAGDHSVPQLRPEQDRRPVLPLVHALPGATPEGSRQRGARSRRDGPQRTAAELRQALGPGLGLHGDRRGAERAGDLRRPGRSGPPQPARVGVRADPESDGGRMSLFANGGIYCELPILLIVVSLVYGATRYDRWDLIVHEAVRWGSRMLMFLGGIALALFVLSIFV